MSMQHNLRCPLNRQNVILMLLIIFCFIRTNAQQIEKIADKPLDVAVKQLGPIVGQQIPDQVKIFAIGNISPLAKESSSFNTVLASYLISQRRFRHIILFEEDWILRPLNDYLAGNMDFDSTVVDSLFRNSLVTTPWCTSEFRSFLFWLKKFNLSHRSEPVRLSGLLSEELIPPAYFLASYIFPLDRQYGLRLSKKWGVDVYNDSMAYSDITAWYQQIDKEPARFRRHQSLMLRCKADLEHNSSIRQNKLLESDIEALIVSKVQAIADYALKQSGERTILYASNEYIAKSEIVLYGQKVSSPGLVIHRQVAEEYYTSLTDFTDSANLQLKDPETGGFKQTLIQGTAQAQTMTQQKRAFFVSQDGAKIQRYIPRTISSLIGEEKEIIPLPGTPATDALFILPRLTPATLLRRN